MAPLDPITEPLPFEPPPFFITDSISRMHNRFRLGNTNDINLLINGEDKNSYLRGIIAGSVLVLCVYLIWAVIIIALRIAGPKRVGFFSGHPPKRPAPPCGCAELLKQEKEREEEAHSEKKTERQQNACNANDEEEQPAIAGRPEAGNDVELTIENESRTKQVPTDVQNVIDDDIDPLSEFSVNDGGNVRKMGEEIGPTKPVSDNGQLHDELALEPISEVASAVIVLSDGDSQHGIVQWKEECRRVDQRVFWARIVIALSGMLMILFSIMFMTKGFQSLHRSVLDLQEVTDDVFDLADEGIILIDNYLDAQSSVFREARVSFNAVSRGYCPDLREELCDENLSFIDPALCDLTGIPFVNQTKEFLLALNETQFFNTTKWILATELISLKDDLKAIQDTTKTIDFALSQFDWAFIVAMTFVIILDLLVIFILIGVWYAWRESLPRAYTCARHYFIMPTIMVLVGLIIIFTIVFLAGGMTGADFCTDDPDQTSRAVVENLENRLDSLIYDMLVFYVNKCEVPPRFFQRYQRWLIFIRNMLMRVHDFNDVVLQLASSNETGICGTNIELVEAASRTMDEQLHVIFQAVDVTRVFFFCENWHPLYTNSVYDALCTHGVEAMRWSVGTLAGITACSMIMVTLRGAWFDVKDGIETWSWLSERLHQRCEQATIEDDVGN